MVKVSIRDWGDVSFSMYFSCVLWYYVAQYSCVCCVAYPRNRIEDTSMAKAKKKPVKLTDLEIERRFARAAVNLKKICKKPPYKLEDLQKALDKAELPFTVTSEADPVAVGLFVWAQCDGQKTNALDFRAKAVERIKSTLPAAARG